MVRTLTHRDSGTVRAASAAFGGAPVGRARARTAAPSDRPPHNGRYRSSRSPRIAQARLGSDHGGPAEPLRNCVLLEVAPPNATGAGLRVLEA